MEMKNVYKSLNEQKLYYEQELIRKKNVLKDTKEERKTLQLKNSWGIILLCTVQKGGKSEQSIFRSCNSGNNCRYRRKTK